jgi:hypothetical protein
MLQEIYAFLSAFSAIPLLVGDIYSAGVAFADLFTPRRETQNPRAYGSAIQI